MTERDLVQQLIKRLSRIDAQSGWSDDLNSAQMSALEYLSWSNQFSKKPSNVADFLSSTRGTVSQTLKSLANKGYVEEVKSDVDKRSISYQLTVLGKEAVAANKLLSGALEALSDDELSRVSQSLVKVLHAAIERNGQRPFGLCKNCVHFQQRKAGAYCGLLAVNIPASETTRICVEQEAAAKSL